jgi:parallel beta-helix repeat protein
MNQKALWSLGGLAGLAAIFLFGYSTDRGYSLLSKTLGRVDQKIQLSIPLLQYVDDFVNEIDFVRVLRRTELHSTQTLHIKFSPADFNENQRKITEFLGENFIRDQTNHWRKAKLFNDGEWLGVKYKFHGTSATPLRLGGISYRFKHEKSGPYWRQMRQFSLISDKDEPDIETIVINQLAREFGLIAPSQELVMLYVNGARDGRYLLYEHPSKEWYEREYGLTQFAVLKSNDDWDRKEHQHWDDTDLFVQNKEVKASEGAGPIALSALNDLFVAVEQENIARVKELLDIDYVAKFLAFATVVNSSHPLVGDNLRYIYDATRGRFKFLFRAESVLVRFNDSLPNFNSTLFDYADRAGAVNTLLFKLLLQDPSFRERRDLFLEQLLDEHRFEFLEIANQLFDQSWNVLLNSNKPMRPLYAKVKRFRAKWLHNTGWIGRYLDYTKVYVTLVKHGTGRYRDTELSILNDSFHAIDLIRAWYLPGTDGETKEVSVNLDPPLRIPPPRLDSELRIIQEPNSVKIPPGTLTRLEFANPALERAREGLSYVADRHIYYNEMIPVKVFSTEESRRSFEKNGVPWKWEGKAIVIEPGSYEIIENLVAPRGAHVIIRPGVTFLVAEGKSIVVRGPLDAGAIGAERIIVKRLDQRQPFGSFAVVANEGDNVRFSNVTITGGSEADIVGIQFLGQLAVHGGKVWLDSIESSNSVSDDGVNIKHAQIFITRSKFIDNYSDQVDLDFCHGIVDNNDFNYSTKDSKETDSNADGLDISGSTILVLHNRLTNARDKAISVGERSTVFLKNNTITGSQIGIALKDESKGYLLGNNFSDNAIDLSLFTKKAQYGPPTGYIPEGSTAPRHMISSGSIEFFDPEKENILNEVELEFQ